MASVTNAAGLGRLEVSSSLGQPFRGEIDVVAGKEDLATLSALIASPAAYAQANLQYNPALLGMRVVVARRPGGEPYLQITSVRSVCEPDDRLVPFLGIHATGLGIGRVSSLPSTSGSRA